MTAWLKRVCVVAGWLLLGGGGLRAQLPVTVYEYQVPAGGYDPVGNLTSYTDTVNGSWTRGYDTLNRLQTATSTDGGSYPGLQLTESYDSFGNRLGQVVSATGPAIAAPNSWSATYDSTNRLTSSSVGAAPPQYDGAGNPLYDGVNTYRYDAESRLCASNNGVTGAMTQYFYDAEGQRVAKTILSGNTLSCAGAAPATAATTKYLLGLSGEQVTELDGTNVWHHTNVYANGALLATWFCAVASTLLFLLFATAMLMVPGVSRGSKIRVLSFIGAALVSALGGSAAQKLRLLCGLSDLPWESFCFWNSYGVSSGSSS